LRADRIVVTDQPADQPGERCPGCQALVRAGVSWCTLCYADLRPAPPRSAAPEADLTSAGASFDPLTAPLALLEHRLESAAQGDQEPEPAATPGWPCLGCGTTVDLDLAACGTCGVGFLDRPGPRDDDLVQRLTRGGVPKMTQAVIIGGGSVLIIVVLIVLAYIGSALL
jgi:hypothetical protein